MWLKYFRSNLGQGKVEKVNNVDFNLILTIFLNLIFNFNFNFTKILNWFLIDILILNFKVFEIMVLFKNKGGGQKKKGEGLEWGKRAKGKKFMIKGNEFKGQNEGESRLSDWE